MGSPFFVKKKSKMANGMMHKDMNGMIAKDMMKGNFENGINFLSNYLNQRNT